MTKRQRIALMAELWPNACEVQGWKEGDRDLRLVVCSIALRCEIRNIVQFQEALRDSETLELLKSTNDIDDGKDFSRVKALLQMLADRLDAGVDNKTRTKRWVIEQQIKCLALYPVGKPMGLAGARAYVQELIRDKFKGGSRAMPLRIEDLSDVPWKTSTITIPSHLDQLLYTLRSRLHNKRTGFRVLAGDSMHDMNKRAGLECSCKICCGGGGVIMMRADQLVNILTDDENEPW